MARKSTRLKKITINNFRALKDISIEIGDNITVICGKNGTSKSSILGIAAQIFSFDKNHSTEEPISFNSLTGERFKSYPAEHFRFSSTYDQPGSMDVSMEIYDGYTQQDSQPSLTLVRRATRNIVRPVVRNNKTIPGRNTSRNYTHPVIYLSLRRLMPIPFRPEYSVRDLEYLEANKAEFIHLNNTLLNKRSSKATATSGTIESAVAHGANYDQDSVSAGEDNAGQIVLAIMSFAKLKKEYADYKGGLLLIDEADAGLFPAAQSQLIKILDKACAELNIQVIMTSHSPIIIEDLYTLGLTYRKKYKTAYLSDTYGSVSLQQDISWPEIHADLTISTIAVSDDLRIPKINLYTEDAEGFALYEKIIPPSLRKYLTALKDVSLGCTNYIQLIKAGVPEFSKRSLVVLDGDVQDVERFTTIVKLPGHLPPDQLIFELLYNMPADDPYWRNDLKFTRPVFTRAADEVVRRLELAEDAIDLSVIIAAYRKKNDEKASIKLRSLFKDFYKHPEITKILKSRSPKINPWKIWISQNKPACEEFKKDFATRLLKVLESGYGIDKAKLVDLIKASK